MLGTSSARSVARHGAPEPVRRRLFAFSAGAVSTALLATAAITALTSGAAAADTRVSLWPDSAVPATSSDVDTRAVELGVVFTSSVDGDVTAISYYKSARNVGPHDGHLWSAGGRQLAAVDFEQESTSGWQTATLDRPVAIDAGQTYVASYTAPRGNYAGDQWSLSSDRPRHSGVLTALRGVYSYDLDFPTDTWNDSNYWVDLEFSPGGAASAPTSTPSPTSSTVRPSSTPTTTRPSASATTASSRPSATPTTTAPRPTTSAPGAKLLCGVDPSACGYPDESTAGVRSSKTLKRVPEDVRSGAGWSFANGTLTITRDGTVLDGYAVNGGVDVSADDVTLRDVDISVGGESFGVALRHANRTTIDQVTIAPPSTNNRLLVGIKDIYGDSSGTTVSGVDISGTSTGVQIYGGLIEDSYIHGLIENSGDHLNGITSNGSRSQLTIRHNTILNSNGQTDAIGLFQDFGVEANRTIDDNLLAGGGYTVYGGAGTKGSTSGIVITNNRFANLWFPRSGYWGPATAFDAGGSGNVWSGNVWDATGLSVGRP